jgi:DNA (cytosine-5)-methyltransferase 1
MGGPPCQGFSPIGKRDPADERNQLIAHFFRLVGEMEPAAFVLENVPGILSPTYRNILRSARYHISKRYTILAPHEMKALEAGAPTSRTRVAIVGFRRPISAEPKEFWSAHQLTLPPPFVREALNGLPVDVHPDAASSRGGRRIVRISRTGYFFESAGGRVPNGVGEPRTLEDYCERGIVTGCLGTLHSSALERRYSALRFGEIDHKTKSVRLDPDGYCPTLRAGTGPERGSFQAVRPIHYLRPRVITPREAARLQGFPDWYQFDRTKWHTFRQLGNSVSPLVSEFIMSRIARVLFHG